MDFQDVQIFTVLLTVFTSLAMIQNQLKTISTLSTNCWYACTVKFRSKNNDN